MKKKIPNVVLVGTGYWGTNIAKNLIKLNVPQIIVYDANIYNSKLLKSRFGQKIEIINDFNVLIKNKKLKYFIFATPPSKNLKLVEQALLHNKKIFVEKPGFKNIKEIDYLIKKYPKQVNSITFGYIYIFNNYIKFIKKFINNKSNGKILYIKFQRQNLGPIRNDVDVSYDLSAHDISILVFLFGTFLKLKNYNSYKILNKKIADISNLSFSIKNFYADINNSWLNPDKIRRMIIITSKKMLLFDEMNNSEKIKIFNKFAEYPKLKNLKNNFFTKKAKIYEGKNFSPKIKDNDTLFDEINSFLNQNKKEKKYTDIKFARYILKILSRIN